MSLWPTWVPMHSFNMFQQCKACPCSSMTKTVFIMIFEPNIALVPLGVHFSNFVIIVGSTSPLRYLHERDALIVDSVVNWLIYFVTIFSILQNLRGRIHLQTPFEWSTQHINSRLLRSTDFRQNARQAGRSANVAISFSWFFKQKIGLQMVSCKVKFSKYFNI